MRRVTLGIAALMLASAPIAYGQQPAQPVAAATIPATFNVKVIATEAFPANIGELRAKFEALNTEFKPQADQLQALRTEIGKLESDLQAQANIAKPEILGQMNAKRERLALDYKQLEERTRADYDGRISEVVGPVYEKIRQFMETYAQQRGISLILDVSSQENMRTFAFIGSDADITQDFINEYNRLNPAAASNAAPQPQQPKNPPPGAAKPKTGRP